MNILAIFGGSRFKNFYSTSANNKSNIDWPEVLGRRGPLLSAHRLANQYINKTKPITAVEVNKVLAFANIEITQSKLDEILIPVAVYSNSDVDKKQILKDNKGKTGIYRWTNLVNGKTYVGSSIDLSIRLSKYYSKKYLKAKLNTGNSAIYSAILKYGNSNFKPGDPTILWTTLCDFLRAIPSGFIRTRV
jgi:hypothetical protein